MKIFFYLCKQISATFFATFTVLLLLFFSGKFVDFLSSAATGRYAIDAVLSILIYTLPTIIEIILPLCLCLAIMLTVGQLYVDSEMVVMKSCGLSDTRLLIYIQGLACLIAAIIACFSLYLTPLGAQKIIELENDPNTYSGLGTLTEGTFKKLDKNTVIYVASMNQSKTELDDIFIASISKKDDVALMRADHGEVKSIKPGKRFMYLNDGELSEFNTQQLDFNFLHFEKAKHVYRDSSVSEQENITQIDATSTFELLNADFTPQALAALLWRFSLPFLAPIAAIFAFAFSETSHRKGRYAKLLPGIVVFVMYFMAVIASRKAIGKEQIGLWAMPAAHGFFLLFGLIVFYRPNIQLLLHKKQSGKEVAV